MWPAESNNFDIVAVDSVTPTSNLGYNLGQDQLRWLFLYAGTGRFSDVVEIGTIADRVRLTYDTASNLMTLDRPLTLSRTPELDSEAATKAYVDTSVAGVTPATDWASVTGASKPLINCDGSDMLFGESAVPTLNQTWDLGKPNTRWRDIYTQFLTASTGAYVGSLECALLTVNSVMSINGNKITQVGAPTTGTDAVNKSYVDNAVAAVSNAGGASDLSEVEAAKFIRVVNNYGEYSLAPNYDYLATIDSSAVANILFGGNYSADTGEEDRSLNGPSDAVTKGYADATYLSVTGSISTNITVPAQSVVETNSTHPTANQLVTKKITEDRYSKKNHDHDGVYAELTVVNWISEFLAEMSMATTYGNLSASSDGTFATASFDIPNTIRFRISSTLLAQNVQTVDSVRLTVRVFHSSTGVYITSADQELGLSFDQATNTILASQTGSLSFGASTTLNGDLSIKVVIDARIAGYRRPVMTANAQGEWSSSSVIRLDLQTQKYH
eukprot:jgi/Tetstr1/424496/TSEL_015024.t1